MYTIVDEETRALTHIQHRDIDREETRTSLVCLNVHHCYLNVNVNIAHR